MIPEQRRYLGRPLRRAIVVLAGALVLLATHVLLTPGSAAAVDGPEGPGGPRGGDRGSPAG